MYRLLQYSHCVGAAVLLLRNNRYGDIFVLHATVNELLRVSTTLSLYLFVCIFTDFLKHIALFFTA